MRKFLAAGLVLGLAMTCVSCSLLRGGSDELRQDEFLELPKIDFAGDVFVDFNSRCEQYPKLAVLPFRAAVELTGAASSDFFITELMKTMRYDLIERSQMDAILKEQQLQLSGVTDDAAAIRVGRMLGVRGVVVGTVSEYGFQRVRISRAPSVALSVRMIDTETGKVVWSVSHSLVGDKSLSLSQHAKDVIEEMVLALSVAWNDAGDRTAAGLPAPRSLKAESGLRRIYLSWRPYPSRVIAGYEIRRKGPDDSDFRFLYRLKNRRNVDMGYVDRNLKDLTLYTYEIRTVSSYGLVSSKTATAEVITAGAPAPVSGLKAMPDGPRRVKVTWSPSADETVTSYHLFRIDPDGTERTLTRLNGRRAGSYVDQGMRSAPLADNTEYTYAITCANRLGLQSDAAKALVTTAPPPSAVQGLQASKGLAGAVKLSWQGSADAERIERYVVSRRGAASEPFRQVGIVSAPKTTFTDRGQAVPLENGEQYAYTIKAVNSAGAASKPVTAIGSTKPGPSAVTGLSASDDQLKSIKLSWQPHKDNTIAAYAIYRSVTRGGSLQKVATVAATQQSYEDKQLPNNASYHYLVRAVAKDKLEGKASATVKGQTKGPPPPPRELACSTRDGAAVLTWEHENPQDIDSYTVYLHSMISSRPVGKSAKEQFVYDKAHPGSTYKFSVDAIDRDGLRSRQSTVTVYRLERN